MEATIVTEVIQTIKRSDVYTLQYYSSGIVELVWDKTLHTVDLDIMKSMRDNMKLLGNGKKLPIYVNTNPFMVISEDAKVFSASTEGQQFTLANAIQVDNLGKQLMYNFFLKFYRLPNPHKAFRNKSEAFQWLQSLL